MPKNFIFKNGHEPNHLTFKGSIVRKIQKKLETPDYPLYLGQGF